MLKKTFFGFLSIGVLTAMAASNTHKVDIYQDSTINGQQLKAGTYKVQLENNMAVLKHGNDTIQAPAREETAPTKFASNEVVYTNNRIQEIDFGGTHTKLVITGNNTSTGM
jgi:hypothetical protein